MLAAVVNLSAACNAQGSKQSISAFSPLRTQYSFDKRQHTRAMKQIKLCSLLLKYGRKSKLFDCASAIIVGGIQRNMCWEIISGRGFFDREESFCSYLLVCWRRSQSKIDLEERGLGFLICHCEISMWLRKCWVDGMKAMSRFRVDQPKSRNPVALSRQRAKTQRQVHGVSVQMSKNLA